MTWQLYSLRIAVPRNVDWKTVHHFGREWADFDQTALSEAEREYQFGLYFAIFPWEALPHDAEGFDLGCGTGRWAHEVAKRVRRLHCVDPSHEALGVARRALGAHTNCEFHLADSETLPFGPRTMDFGYALGVLHHVPDPQRALSACVEKLKPGAPFLLYVYYALDNRPRWFRAVWRAAEVTRRVVSRLPYRLKYLICSGFAAFVYYPLARAAGAAERLNCAVDGIPLAEYRHRSFYSMRTDALDRFGTRLERRFSRTELVELMTRAGLTDVTVSPSLPYWCAVGRRPAKSAQVSRASPSRASRPV